MKMDSERAKELLKPLQNGKARDITGVWRERMIEVLERVIELEQVDNKTCSNCQRPILSPQCGSCGERNNWQMHIK